MKHRDLLNEARAIAVGFLALFLWLYLLLMMAGCSPAPTSPSARAATEGYAAPGDTLWSGFWAREPAYWGNVYVNAWDDSTLNCVAVFHGWTRWGLLNREFGEHLWWIAVFDLHLEPDSTVTSKLLGTWTQDSLGVFNQPLPDSLGTVQADVVGTYSLADSFFTGQMEDTTGYWIDVYEVKPGLRLIATAGAPKLDQVSRWELLQRIGPTRKALDMDPPLPVPF